MSQQIFYLAYHLHWSRSEILSMDVKQRWGYVGMLANRIDEENRANEAFNKQFGHS